MMISALVAVALGLAPVSESSQPQVVHISDDIVRKVGRYAQFTDGKGITHVRGIDRLGRGYDLAIDAHGHVTGDAGNRYVTFDAADAG